MRYSFYTADVFTNQIFGGNPLAVFPLAEGLNSAQMQKVAAEINYSETVFVFPPETASATKRLRIFTPKAEIPFAGHPTVGTAFVLAAINEIPVTSDTMTLIFEEGIGLVPVKIISQAGKPIYSELTAAQLPEFGPEPPSVEILAELLSLHPEQILTQTYYPQSVSCGLPFLFIPLCDRRALDQASLKLELWEKYLGQNWANSVYLFCFDQSDHEIDIHARMFAPALGITEDPATGSAATALGGYLAQRNPEGGWQSWQIEQGRVMGRPSQLVLKVYKSGPQIETITVGGTTVLVSQGTMEIPA
ncbi:MAG: PhzF family phenazine biosynthesis protein [Microcystaceae cyanobacterium]